MWTWALDFWAPGMLSRLQSQQKMKGPLCFLLGEALSKCWQVLVRLWKHRSLLFPVPINTFKSLDFHIVYNSLSLYLSGITISNCAKPLFFWKINLVIFEKHRPFKNMSPRFECTSKISKTLLAYWMNKYSFSCTKIYF